MTIIRIALTVTLTTGLAASAMAQVPPAPPARPAPLAVQAVPAPPTPPRPAPAAPAARVPPAPPALPDWSNLQLPDLSQIELPDLSNLNLPDFSYVDLPDLSDLHLELENLQLNLHAWQGPFPTPAGKFDTARAQQDQLYNLYDQARAQIEQSQYDRAITSLDRVIAGNGPQAPGAMYWKAYSLARIARRPDAVTTLDELIKQFPKSAWLRDAQALRLELRQASGQSISADAQGDDELKLLALRGLMQSDPETALPVIEKMLNGASSVRVKDRALFVVSQSRSTRGRSLLVGVAKGNGNPDLQLKAIRYIGQMGGTEAAQTLDEVYRATAEERVKGEIIRALGSAKARERLLALAKGETSADLRGDAVRQLGNMSAANELEQLYRSESSADVKRRILQGMQNGNNTDKLAAIARSETDPELRRAAIRYLGNTRGTVATETLTTLYAAEQSEDVKRAIIEGLSNGDRAAALVSLARSEKNQTLKQEIVRRLGNMRDPAAREYLLELLN